MNCFTGFGNSNAQATDGAAAACYGYQCQSDMVGRVRLVDQRPKYVSCIN